MSHGSTVEVWNVFEIQVVLPCGFWLRSTHCTEKCSMENRHNTFTITAVIKSRRGSRKNKCEKRRNMIWERKGHISIWQPHRSDLYDKTIEHIYTLNIRVSVNVLQPFQRIDRLRGVKPLGPSDIVAVLIYPSLPVLCVTYFLNFILTCSCLFYT